MIRPQRTEIDADFLPQERDLLTPALTALRGFGLEAEAMGPKATDVEIDGWLRIGRGKARVAYLLELKRQPTPVALGALKALQQTQDAPLFLVADYVTPQMAERLREADIGFADAAGNAYVDQRGVLIWQVGRRPPALPKTTRVWQPAGLKVIFALLCAPTRVNDPVRIIAETADVAHGTVGRLLDDLREMSYVRELGARPGRGRGRTRVLQNGRALLELWIEAYPRVLRPKLKPRRFRTVDKRNGLDWWRKAKLDPDMALLGGEPAAACLTSYLKPGEVTVYTTGDRNGLVKRHRLIPDQQGTTLFLDRFWRFEHEWGHPDLVPPVLIYADLLATADDRCVETARMVYEQHIARHIEDY